LDGKDLIAVIKECENDRNAVAGMYRKKTNAVL
jgi:hypothetical protein